MIRTLAFLLLLAMPANAAPPPGADANSQIAVWYRSLKQPGTGIGCCSEADCRPVHAKYADGGWEIIYNDEWIEVPDNIIIRDKTHPAGQAVACIYAGRLLCFVEPSSGG